LFSEDLEFVLDRTADLFDDLRGETLFLTGGTGFFGRWMTETFDYANRRLKLGARRLTLTRRPANGADYWQGDVRSFSFPPIQAAFALHLAFDGSDLTTSELGTQRVAEFCHACNCRRWLFASSGAAYSPETELGKAKLAAERAARGAVIARCYCFIGPHLPLDSKFAAGNFLRDKLLGRPIQVAGDGSAVRSYLYAAELAVHLWQLLFRGKPERIYDIGAREEVTVGELAARFDHPIEFLGQTVPSTVYVPRNGIQPEVPLDVALARTERWYRQLQCESANSLMVAMA
jgi:dTDP-glucose 4,6-dehydratase